MTTVQLIPIQKIRILNPRSRSPVRFREIVENIAKVGLKKPITVSRRPSDDGFDLVCGQGRLEAYQLCGAKEIPAILVEAPLESRLLMSLVENLTRRSPSSLELARDLVTLKTRGRSHTEIASLVGLSEGHVTAMIRLVENGEERLIAAVERGEIPVTTAMQIATSDDASLQRSLQEAYDSGTLKGRALVKVKRLVEDRRAKGKGLRTNRVRGNKAPSPQDLVRVLRRETQRQALLIKKSRHCEQQLRFVLSALKDLLKNERFVNILRVEKLDAVPKYLHDLIQR